MSYSAGHVQDARCGGPQPAAHSRAWVGKLLAFPENLGGSPWRVCVVGLDEGTLPGTERQESPQILCGVPGEHPDY